MVNVILVPRSSVSLGHVVGVMTFLKRTRHLKKPRSSGDENVSVTLGTSNARVHARTDFIKIDSWLLWG